MRKARFAPWQWFLDRSITTILVCIVLLAALPAMAIIVVSSFEARSHAENHAWEEISNLTRSLAAVQRGITGQADGILATLDHTEGVRNRDKTACVRLFSSLLRDHPELSNIFMTNATGQVTASALPDFTDVNLGDRKYFREAMASKTFGVGEFILGKSTGKPILVFARAVLDAAGNPDGIIGMSYFLEGYETFLSNLEMSPLARITFLDAKGLRLVAHPPDTRFPLGKQANGHIWEQLGRDTRNEGTFVATRYTGGDGLFGFARLRLSPQSPPYMTILVSAASSAVFQDADAFLWRGLGSAILATLFALLIARLVGQAAIGRGIASLADVAGRLAAGDLSTRVGDEGACLEIRRLGQSFNTMAAVLETHEQELTEAALALGKMRAMLHNILESMPSAIIGCDSTGRVTHINRNAEVLFGLDRSTAMGTSVADFLPVVSASMQSLEQSLRERRALVVEKLSLSQDGDTHLMDMLFYPLIANGTEGVVIRLDDVTEREEARKGLERALDEKNILLKEIHHRVKNNLQIILSFISLQAEDAADADEQDRFRQLEIRIRSMALVHQQLYNHSEVATVDMGEYTATLTEGIVKIFRKALPDLALLLDTVSFRLPLDKAVPCGLLLAELITNACKHAFNPGRSGELRVGSRLENGLARIWVEDSGQGLPEGYDYAKAQTMGMTLIRELVRQLQGRVVLTGTGGLRFEISFPV